LDLKKRNLVRIREDKLFFAEKIRKPACRQAGTAILVGL
jgi:hypothetical protein